jgi:hypothetical protein
MYNKDMSAWSIAYSNLTSVGVLAFILGFLASRVKGNLKLPESSYQFISIYLLFGIGLKGGHSLKSVGLGEFLKPALTTLVSGVLVATLAFFSLGLIKKLSVIDRGSIAAHYGSTSLVTFSAALLFMESNGIFVEGYAPALLTLIEIPGLIVGIFLASSRGVANDVHWAAILKEVIFGKTVLILVGATLIGFLTTSSGYEKVAPLFIELLSGFLALFLLHLGYSAGANFKEVRSVGWPLGIFAIVFPITSGLLGTTIATATGFSIGGATVFGVLCASASYIAAPAAVSIALPKANLGLALTASVGVTFPFNLILGIPLYYSAARFLTELF